MDARERRGIVERGVERGQRQVEREVDGHLCGDERVIGVLVCQSIFMLGKEIDTNFYE